MGEGPQEVESFNRDFFVLWSSGEILRRVGVEGVIVIPEGVKKKKRKKKGKKGFSRRG